MEKGRKYEYSELRQCSKRADNSLQIAETAYLPAANSAERILHAYCVDDGQALQISHKQHTAHQVQRAQRDGRTEYYGDARILSRS